MYQRRMQQVRRVVHERRVHEMQRRQRDTENRQQMMTVVHSIVR